MSKMPYPSQAVLDQVNDWLANFEAALTAKNEGAISSLFAERGDWRDLVSFSWNIRTVYGPKDIASELVRLNVTTRSQGFGVDASRTPPRKIVRAGDEVIEAIFSFETDVGQGAGVLRLVEEAGEFKALALMTSLHELKDFPELRGQHRPHGTAYSRTFGGENWADLRNVAQAFQDREPEVLVIGAGQAGLSVAARLNVLGVDTLVIDAYPRVGDVWRERYHSLTLHNETWVASMPYLEFPDTWPTYLPKDKLAGWLEYYAEAMEINVWNSTKLVSGDYDETSEIWSITVDKDGETRQVRPKHVIVCTGSVSGVPNKPQIEGIDSFNGEVMHSSEYTSGTEFNNRKAIVFGTGTSAHDVAQDLHALGSEVTIVQRNPTTVVSLEPSGIMVYALYSEGLPLEDADLISAANSYETLIRANQLAAQKMVEADADLIERLEKVGFKTDIGEDNTGFHLKYNRRGGGYYINVGASDLIADGEIKLLQWDDFKTFTPDGIQLKDGSTMDLDLAVLATGYRNQQEDVRRWFGDEIADRVGPVWGVDEDGEMRNVWRPTRQDGLWFNAGSLAACRANSKYLALMIKANLEGLTTTSQVEGL